MRKREIVTKQDMYKKKTRKKCRISWISLQRRGKEKEGKRCKNRILLNTNYKKKKNKKMEKQQKQDEKNMDEKQKKNKEQKQNGEEK